MYYYVLVVLYMKIHVPSMLAIGVETINKQTQQTNKQTSSHKGLENIKAATLAYKNNNNNQPPRLRK